jgi:hypothetical protein
MLYEGPPAICSHVLAPPVAGAEAADQRYTVVRALVEDGHPIEATLFQIGESERP